MTTEFITYLNSRDFFDWEIFNSRISFRNFIFYKSKIFFPRP